MTVYISSKWSSDLNYKFNVITDLHATVSIYNNFIQLYIALQESEAHQVMNLEYSVVSYIILVL